MFRIFLVLMIVVPIVELWGIITVGSVIGGWQTVALLFLTGIFGAWLAKREGMQVLRLIGFQLSRGEMPTDAVIDGLLILVGGVLLLTPGFFTDLVGLVFLIPYTRMIIRHFTKKWLWSQIKSGRFVFFFRR